MSTLTDEFKLQRTKYQQLENLMQPLLAKLANTLDVEVFRIEGRTKSVESLDGKINRPEKVGKYSTLEEITDLCGLRVITFGDGDSEKIIKAIRSSFVVDEPNSVDKAATLNADQFGYRSRHLVVTMTNDRSSLFEYKDLGLLKFEIQVRTVLQHAWASLDWKLRYKSEIEAPVELRRKLYRVSALLEAAEDTFSDLQAMMVKLQAEYANGVLTGKLIMSINKDSLYEFFTKATIITSIVSRCISQGIDVFVTTDFGTQQWDYLIRSLTASGINSLDELENSLLSLKENNYDEFKNVFDRAKASKSVFKLGIFSTIRFLIISTLPLDKQKEAIMKAPSSGSWGLTEADYIRSKTE